MWIILVLYNDDDINKVDVSLNNSGGLKPLGFGGAKWLEKNFYSRNQIPMESLKI